MVQLNQSAECKGKIMGKVPVLLTTSSITDTVCGMTASVAILFGVLSWVTADNAGQSDPNVVSNGQ
jgi:hypothetical protein